MQTALHVENAAAVDTKESVAAISFEYSRAPYHGISVEGQKNKIPVSGSR
jgi:hypothetical protein